MIETAPISEYLLPHIPQDGWFVITDKIEPKERNITITPEILYAKMREIFLGRGQTVDAADKLSKKVMHRTFAEWKVYEGDQKLNKNGGLSKDKIALILSSEKSLAYIRDVDTETYPVLRLAVLDLVAT